MNTPTKLTRLPATIDWTDDAHDRTPVTNRRETYVPAATSRGEMPRVELARPEIAVQLDYIPTSTTHVEVTGDHVSRSRAWLNYSLPLCLAFALVILVLAILFTPLLNAGLGAAFLRAVGLYFAVFVASYAGMFIYYTNRSPEGQAYRNSRDMWQFLRTEQSHRHVIEREAWTIQRDRLTGGRQ